MSLSTCCQVITVMAYEGTLCTQCWQICSEYSSPCDTCGSNGPCRCWDETYLEEPQPGQEILEATKPLFEARQSYPDDLFPSPKPDPDIDTTVLPF